MTCPDRGKEMSAEEVKLDYNLFLKPELTKKYEEKLSKLLGTKVKFRDKNFDSFGIYLVDVDNPKKVTYKKGDVLVTESYANTFAIGHLSQLEGCCGVLVSYHFSIEKQYQDKGVGNVLQELKEEVARTNGYSLMLCTVISTNEKEIHLLEKYNWYKINEFVNSRTGNTVYTYVKDIKND